MSLRLLNIKIKTMIKNEKNYTFPEFIFALRRCLGISRKVACEDMRVLQSRLFSLEHGNFIGLPKETSILAKYYGIPLSLMKHKAKLFSQNSVRIKIERMSDSEVI